MRRITKRIILPVFSLALLAGCDGETRDTAKDSATAVTAAPETTEKVERPDGPGLTADYAAWRKQQVADVDYHISVDLDGESDTFSGRLVADTKLAGALQQSLTIDFTGGDVKAVSVGGKAVPFDYNDFFISIAPEHLAKGDNQITIDYTHPYSTDGSGLHRFRDPQDGSVYLYTHFEPYKANRFAPLFDQPDLKASYTLDVKAPADWKVVTAAREDNIEDLADGRKHWHFPATKKILHLYFPAARRPLCGLGRQCR